MIRKFVPEFEPVPKYYGVAYRESHRLGAICYPIPLNLVVSVWHHFYEWLTISQWDWKTEHDKNCETCFQKGRDSVDKSLEIKLRPGSTIRNNFVGPCGRLTPSIRVILGQGPADFKGEEFNDPHKR